MRSLIVLAILILSFSSTGEAGFFQKKEIREATGTPESRARDEEYRKMFLQNQLMDEASSLEMAFELVKSNELFGKAQGPEYITTEYDKGLPLLKMLRNQVHLFEYERALNTANDFIQVSPGNDWGVEQKQKIEALIEWKNTGNKQPIYNWISMMKQKHVQWLPPQNIVFHSTGIMIQFVELYDLLGDYEAAIEYIQPFLKRHQTVKNNDYKINEHLALIQVLNESKQGMPKICIEDGKVCLGRATAYIIKSKSF